MATDKTFGIKVTEELNDQAKSLIEASGLTGKEWLEKVIALYEVNSLKDSIASDYSADLTELEVHTTRIYTLISNMIARSTYLKDSAVKEISEKLDSKESIITDLQEKNKELKAIVNEFETKHKTELQEKTKLGEQLLSIQTTLDNNQALIEQYKEKNDTLNGLVSKYRGYAEENEQLKDTLNTTKAEFQQQLTEANKNNEQLAYELQNVKEQLARALQNATEQLEKTKEQHESTISLLIDKKDIEREKALVELERTHQEELKTANEKVRSLYDEIESIRNTHAAQIQELKQSLEKATAQANKKAKNENTQK